MAMQSRVAPVRGAKIRLLHDIATRGGTTFRAGLEMTVDCTEGGYSLEVRVRAKWHTLRLQKQDYPRLFEVIELPEA